MDTTYIKYMYLNHLGVNIYVIDQVTMSLFLHLVSLIYNTNIMDFVSVLLHIFHNRNVNTIKIKLIVIMLIIYINA